MTHLSRGVCAYYTSAELCCQLNQCQGKKKNLVAGSPQSPRLFLSPLLLQIHQAGLSNVLCITPSPFIRHGTKIEGGTKSAVECQLIPHGHKKSPFHATLGAWAQHSTGFGLLGQPRQQWWQRRWLHSLLVFRTVVKRNLWRDWGANKHLEVIFCRRVHRLCSR